MIDKSNFDKVPSKNVIDDYTPPILSDSTLENAYEQSLDNMVLNSNLENKNVIK